MRIYSLLMAISITCGGGKGGEDASATTGGESTADPSGTTGSSDATPTTGEPPPNTSSLSEASAETGPATTQSEGSTADPGASTGAGDTEDGDATAGTSGDSTGEGVPEHATVDNSCAPDDGAALEFRVGLAEAVCGAPWSGDQLRLLVYQGAPLAPGVYPLDGGLGGATFDDGQGLVFGSSGSLTIESWAEDAVVGSYEVTLEDRSVHAGDFVGPHCATMPMCG